jgi:hypothetical protein
VKPSLRSVSVKATTKTKKLSLMASNDSLNTLPLKQPQRGLTRRHGMSILRLTLSRQIAAFSLCHTLSQRIQLAAGVCLKILPGCVHPDHLNRPRKKPDWPNQCSRTFGKPSRVTTSKCESRYGRWGRGNQSSSIHWPSRSKELGAGHLRV